jgi:GNAT superfamily N-acetyltransferase
MGAVSIRRAGPDDGDSLFAIHRESVLAAYAGVFPPDRYRFPEEEMRAHWQQALTEPDRVYLVAERSGRPVGFAGISPGWLRNLFVVPGEWGKGVGGVLHDSAVGLLRADGAAVRLWVLEANERARSFYERRGGRTAGASGRNTRPTRSRSGTYSTSAGRRTHPNPPPTQGMEFEASAQIETRLGKLCAGRVPFRGR